MQTIVILNLFNFVQFAYARHSSSKLDSALAQSQISGSHCEPSQSILRGQMLKQFSMTRMIGTPALKSSNKFGISLAYSYLWRPPKVLPLTSSSSSLQGIRCEHLLLLFRSSVLKSSNEFGISLTYWYLCQHEKDDSYLLRVLCGALFQGSDVPAMCAEGH